MQEENAQANVQGERRLLGIICCLLRGGTAGASSLVWEREAAEGEEGMEPFPWPCSALRLGKMA